MSTVDEDYRDDVNEVVFRLSPNNTSFSFRIPLVDDNTFELDEMLSASLSLFEPAPRVTIAPEQATVRIVDDDGEMPLKAPAAIVH